MARTSWTIDAADEAAMAGSRWNEIKGTSGNDDLVGTAGRDRFHLGDGGNDTAKGLGGNDWFELYENYTKRDHVDGGDGNDTVWIGGTMSESMLDPDHLISIERFYLFSPRNTIVIADGFEDIIFTGRYVGTTVDASHLTTGSVCFLGEHAGATLIGGEKGDVFFADSGKETFTGGGGRDRFVFGSLSDSTGGAADLITDFDEQDVIKLPEIAGGYHVHATAAQKGDIAFSYDSGTDRTLVDVNLLGVSDHLMVYLSGDLSLKLVHDAQIILG